MGTPEQPEASRLTSRSSLYGECASGINQGLAVIGRRALIGGALALPVAASARGWGEDDLLTRALRAAGGRERLERVKALNWTGEATVANGDRTLKIQVKTRVEPFVRARSESWLAGHVDDVRTMIIEPDGGFLERGGKRTALPSAQAEHERQQFGIYGYMLLAKAQTSPAGDRLVANRRGLPPVSFFLEGDYLAGADYDVVSPEGNGPVKQRFLFEGEFPDKGIHWPQTITIFHGDISYFMLDFQTFSVVLT